MSYSTHYVQQLEQMMELGISYGLIPPDKPDVISNTEVSHQDILKWHRSIMGRDAHNFRLENLHRAFNDIINKDLIKW